MVQGLHSVTVMNTGERMLAKNSCCARGLRVNPSSPRMGPFDCWQDARIVGCTQAVHLGPAYGQSRCGYAVGYVDNAEVKVVVTCGVICSI